MDEVGTFPADVLWRFRMGSLATQLAVWTTLGLAFGALTERAAAPGTVAADRPLAGGLTPAGTAPGVGGASPLDAPLALLAGVHRVLDLGHLDDQVGRLDQPRVGVAAR